MNRTMGLSRRIDRPRRRPSRRIVWIAAGLLISFVLAALIRFTPFGLFVALPLAHTWGQWVAGPDTRAARAGIARWIPGTRVDLVHDVYHYEEPGWMDHPAHLRFQTVDTAIVRAFLGGIGTDVRLQPDSAPPYRLVDRPVQWQQFQSV
jgi:hypothetical protein